MKTLFFDIKLMAGALLGWGNTSIKSYETPNIYARTQLTSNEPDYQSQPIHIPEKTAPSEFTEHNNQQSTQLKELSQQNEQLAKDNKKLSTQIEHLTKEVISTHIKHDEATMELSHRTQKLTNQLALLSQQVANTKNRPDPLDTPLEQSTPNASINPMEFYDMMQSLQHASRTPSSGSITLTSGSAGTNGFLMPHNTSPLSLLHSPPYATTSRNIETHFLSPTHDTQDNSSTSATRSSTSISRSSSIESNATDINTPIIHSIFTRSNSYDSGFGSDDALQKSDMLREELESSHSRIQNKTPHRR